MKKLWDLKKLFGNLEPEGQGRGIIMGVTRLFLLGLFYAIQTKSDQTLCTPVYVLAGAYYFQNSENWSYWNAVNFCDVTLTTMWFTLTTMWFGNIVPKTNARGDQNPEISIVFSALYICFGILLIFMTFEMVQDQVVSALKKVASRLGLIKEYNW